MQLYISLTSPYARKARMVALEKGLGDLVQIKAINLRDNPVDLWELNPLREIPTLRLESGEVLYDSRVICAYFEQLNDQPQLIPSQGIERFRILRLEALADGMTDAAVGALFARIDNGDQPDTPGIKRKIAKIPAVLKVMQDSVADFEGQLNLGTIACGAALGYLDLRYDDLQWRSLVPDLAGWFEEFAKRPAMIKTVPSV